MMIRQGGNFPAAAARFLAVGGAVGLLLLLGLVATSGLVVVDNGRAAVLIRKTGEDLPNGEILAGPGQKGIQMEMLPEGWHWRNPYVWDWEIVEQLDVPAGKVAVRVRTHGKPLPAGRVIAEDGERGILRDVLRPGRYLNNPYAYSVTLANAVTVESGHVGVVTLVSGRPPANPNVFLVEPGERGVQKLTVSPGTYYPNPYIEQITPIDIRSHRFDMMGEKVIRFPSLDGFDISMEGTIEWFIDPMRVAEVFTKYVDERPVMECVVTDILLPNARAFSRIEGSKHLARDFIGGATREKFQEQFLAGLKKACAAQGIMIQSALVRQITPPEAIAKPIKEREIAVRKREMYEQQKERERQQRLLSMEEKMKDRKNLATAAAADAAVALTGAEQEKEVALIQANRELEVARLQLKAAQNQAEAKISEGRAKADVILLKNEAEALGLKNAVAAFGSGAAYVQYLMNQRLAPGLGSILSNTEGSFAELILRAMSGPKVAPRPAGGEKR
jgi:regulator of protease activity HflC (stomatin/prohibitin superfamily)